MVWNGKTLVDKGGPRIVHWDWDEAIPGKHVLGCGQRTILETLLALSHLSKVKISAWLMTQKFKKFNMGPCVLLKFYNKVFVCNPTNLGNTQIMEHVNDIGDAPAVHVTGWRVSPTVREIIQTELHLIWEARVIHPSQTPYSSYIFLMKKKNRGIHF